MEFQVKTHDSERDGRNYSLEHLREEWLKPEKLKKGLIATDMDGTMFNNDLGVVLFIEQMLEPYKWKLNRTQFERILLPGPYLDMIEDAMHEENSQLPIEQCRRLLMLRMDLEQLYVVQRRLLDAQNSVVLPSDHPIVIEFMRKMIEFDRLIMTMSPYFSSRMDGKFLMRVRFLTGMKIAKKLYKLIRRIFKRRKDSPERFLQLKVPRDDESDFPSRRIKAEELSSLTVDRYTPIIEPVRVLLKQCLYGGAHIAVVSANIDGVVKKAVTHSNYRFLKLTSGGKCFTIAGTSYQVSGRGNRRVFTPFQASAPYFGERKAIVAEQRAKARSRILIAACGDSYHGDSAMALRALIRGGIFVAVGGNYESTRRTFHPLYEQAQKEGIKHAGQKIWYVETDNPDNIRDAKG